MAGLNPNELSQFIKIVGNIHSSGITILIIEHVMRAVMQLCSRIIVLDHGEKIAEGSPLDVSKNTKVLQVYLGE
jgi:branched-chain amino acid transport system ATP-binding protein